MANTPEKSMVDEKGGSIPLGSTRKVLITILYKESLNETIKSVYSKKSIECSL